MDVDKTIINIENMTLIQQYILTKRKFFATLFFVGYKNKQLTIYGGKVAVKSLGFRAGRARLLAGSRAA